MIAVYVATAIGIPVYMHYCGGELEQVSFVVKSNSCCGGEEEDMDDGCCANENTFARFAPDFTAKKINNGVEFNITSIELNYTDLFNTEINFSVYQITPLNEYYPPPNLLQQDIISVSVLRI